MSTMLRRGVHATLPAVLLLVSGLDARAQDPLFTPVQNAGAAAAAWDQVQRQSDPSISQTQFVRVDTLGLQALIGNRANLPGAFTLDLLGDVHVADLTGVERVYKHYILRGSLRGTESSVVLALGDTDATAGVVEVGDAQYVLSYTGIGDLHALHGVDGTAQAKTHLPCGTNKSHEVAVPVEGAGAPAAASSVPTQIDVCVFYTPRARSSAGGQASIESTIASRIATATAGSAASGVDHTLNLAYTGETNYTETGTTTDLGRFRGTNDGYMDEVHALRNTYGGDLMALIINNSSQFCGVAYLMTNLSTSFRSNAFSVTVRGCLSGHTLTHEMGHSMGSSHDRANGSRGIFSYSYGYRSSNNQYRTIMAYSPGTRINKWSGPNVVHSGFTMGTVNDDNARSLNNAKVTVSNFKQSAQFLWTQLPGGIRGWLTLTPSISGEGTTNGTVPGQINLSLSLLGAPGALMIGTSTLNQPIFGGTLVPNPLVSLPVTGNPTQVGVPVPWIVSLPTGVPVYFQAWYIDAFAAQGLSATDGLSVEKP